jgi:hypothetical protein
MKKNDTTNPETGGIKDIVNEAKAHFSTRTGCWVLFATVLASSLAFINQSTLIVALPALQSALGASGSELLWVINGYNLMIASFLLLVATFPPGRRGRAIGHDLPQPRSPQLQAR